MAQQTINIGSSANDGTGDPLRTAFDKINDNFTELYGSTAEANDLIEDSTPQLGGDLDVNGKRITSARSNEDIILLPNGTGGVGYWCGVRKHGQDMWMLCSNAGCDVCDHPVHLTSRCLGTVRFLNDLGSSVLVL